MWLTKDNGRTFFQAILCQSSNITIRYQGKIQLKISRYKKPHPQDLFCVTKKKTSFSAIEKPNLEMLLMIFFLVILASSCLVIYPPVPSVFISRAWYRFANFLWFWTREYDQNSDSNKCTMLVQSSPTLLDVGWHNYLQTFLHSISALLYVVHSINLLERS